MIEIRKIKMKSSYFKSITFRFSVALLVIITVAELVAGAIWFYASKLDKEETAKDTLTSLSSSITDTFSYFQSLPINYRHLILNQLRETGGTRFFISINNTMLDIENLDSLTFAPWLSDFTEVALKETLPHHSNIQVSITRREDIKLFNSGVKLNELPVIWSKYGLSLSELDLPIVVVQIEMAKGEWFYIASVIPLSFSALTTQFIDHRQLLFLVITTVLLMLCTTLLLQREFRPIKALAKSATLMGSTFHITELKEEGSNETQAAIHAFNKMNRRIQAYMADRDMLFSAISHDLKTPLACLKFRTEMLDDENAKLRFEKLLNEMDTMLHGALRCMKDTDTHEMPIDVDLKQLLLDCAEDYNHETVRVEIHVQSSVQYLAKPITLKRCITNIIDNGVRYGDHVDVYIDTESTQESVLIVIRDYGDGLTPQQIEKAFEPYYRAGRKDQAGSGLGLTISRSIARSQGGDLRIRNHHECGLEVQIALPRKI